MANGEVFSAFVRFFVKDEVSSEAKKVEASAEKAADGMDKAADAGGKRLKSGLEKASGAAAAAGKGLAVLGAGATALVGAAFGLSGATEEVQENLGKLDTAFEASGNSVEAGRKAYSDFYGLVGDSDQATEAASNLAKLTTNQEELNKWTNISAGAFATFGDALPIENLTETANETAKTGAITGSMADVLNWSTASAEEWGASMGGNKKAQDAWNAAIADGMTKEDAFNEALAACTDEQERATLITDALNGVYGEAGEAYQKQNADLIASRQAQAEWNNKLAEAGAAVRPMVTAIMEMGTALLTYAMPHLQTFATFIMANLPAIQAKFQWFIDNLPIIAPIAAALVAAFVGFQVIGGIISGVTSAINTMKTATVAMKTAQLLLNTAMRANPVGAVITVVMLLVGALVTAFNTNETFRNAVIGAWNAIKSAISSVGSFIMGIVSSIGTTFSNVFNGVKNTVSNAIKFVKGLFNFSWSLPRPKLPRFKISGGQAPWGFLGQGSLPSVGITWNAKGAVFSEPTIFPTAQGFQGVGEAGAEAVAPIGVLQKYVRDAVADAMGSGGGYVANINVTTGETSEAKLAKLISREQKRNAYALGVV